MQKDLKEQLVRCIELMQKDVAAFEAKYQGRFAEEPHVGLGNRKTRCVNEATLPIITCHPSCLEKCVGTCYVINICTKPRPNCRRVEARNTVLRRIDPNAYYEHFYREAERLHLPIRLSDGGDFEDAEQVKYTKRIELLPELVDRPANLHARYSAWEGDEAGEAEARRLGFDVTHVVWDGTGNCPYQKSLARFLARKHEIARALRAQGLDAKAANKRAERETEKEITVWHCRNCAEHGCGCCGTGDIRFNVVGEGDWALRAAEKVTEVSA